MTQYLPHQLRVIDEKAELDEKRENYTEWLARFICAAALRGRGVE